MEPVALYQGSASSALMQEGITTTAQQRAPSRLDEVDERLARELNQDPAIPSYFINFEHVCPHEHAPPRYHLGCKEGMLEVVFVQREDRKDDALQIVYDAGSYKLNFWVADDQQVEFLGS